MNYRVSRSLRDAVVVFKMTAFFSSQIICLFFHLVLPKNMIVHVAGKLVFPPWPLVSGVMIGLMRHLPNKTKFMLQNFVVSDEQISHHYSMLHKINRFMYEKISHLVTFLSTHLLYVTHFQFGKCISLKGIDQ